MVPTMTWFDGRMCGFDLETTDKDPESARIVTAAMVFVGGGIKPHQVTLVANPGVDIPEEAAGIHGYTTERAQAEGMDAAEAVGLILETLDSRGPDEPIVTFNARYDFTVLDREARRHGLVPLSERDKPLLIVDPLVIDKHIHRYRSGSRKLGAIAKHYGGESEWAKLEDAHDATADAMAAARVAYCIGTKGRIIRKVRGSREEAEFKALLREWEAVRHDLPLLHAAQVRWAAFQAEGLEEHFRSQGTLERPVDREWPIIPVRVTA